MDWVIVDIDGTLADTRHRLHHLAKTPKDWPSFYEAMEYDEPYPYVVSLVQALWHKFAIVLVTGRPENYREITKRWLEKQGMNGYPELYMRKERDFRVDTVIKKEILDQLIAKRGTPPTFAIDDRPEVVKMWRDNNVPCLQVDPSPWYAPIKDNQDLVEWLRWMKSQHHDLMFERCADEIIALRKRVGELGRFAYYGLEDL